MTDNRSGNSPDRRSASEARPTTVAATDSSISHTHSAPLVNLTDDQLDCAVYGELRVRVDSSVSREATGRHRDDPAGQFGRYQREIDRLTVYTSPFAATIRSIPHAEHRYSTVGDWTFRVSEGVAIDVAVSATTDWRHAALIAVHELIEAILCRHRGISQDEVDSFDLAHPELDEPGLSENCPYRREHLHAHHVEVNLAYELGVDWQEYTAALDILDSLDD